MALLLILVILSVIAIGITVHALVTDGYHRMPVRPPDSEQEAPARYR